MRFSRLEALAEECALDFVGVTTAEAFYELRDFLAERRTVGAYPPPFAAHDDEKRLNPASVLPAARSVIVAGVSYLPAKRPSPPREQLRGRVSASAWGQDYHQVLEKRLLCLRDRVAAEAGGSFVIQVDNGPFLERAAAVRAGLGHYGKNCSFMHERFGSWVFLGLIVTDLEFDQAKKADPHDTCGDCRKCLDACPTRALEDGYRVNPYRCVSYLTQMKGPIPTEFRECLGTRIFGCDTCQDVCPRNPRAEASPHPDFLPEEATALPDLLHLVELTNKGFRETFGSTAAGWRGRTVLQRNAIYALGNLRDKRAVPKLVAVVSGDPRSVIRSAAAWALGKIGGAEAREALEEALRRELDPDVRREIDEAFRLTSP